MLLAQTRDRVQQPDRSNRSSTKSVCATRPDVDHTRANRRDGREKLCLADDVAHGLDVNGVDREESRADDGGDWPEQIEQERENKCAQRGVEYDARQVKHPWRAAADCPL